MVLRSRGKSVTPPFLVALMGIILAFLHFEECFSFSIIGKPFLPSVQRNTNTKIPTRINSLLFEATRPSVSEGKYNSPCRLRLPLLREHHSWGEDLGITSKLRTTNVNVKKISITKKRYIKSSRLFASTVSASSSSPMQQVLGKSTRNAIINTFHSIGKRILLVLPLFFSTFSGGFLAGSLHSVTGPDHLAALLPRCIGKSWGQALKVGAVWGLGHGASAFIMGFVAFLLKGRLEAFHFKGFNVVDQLSLYTEGLIGLSLIAIGLIGIQEGLSYHTNPEALIVNGNESVAEIAGGEKENDGGVVSKEVTKEDKNKNSAIFLNGLLHGFSWDGTPTLAPALAFTSWKPVSLFLSAYGLGTVVSMAFATTLIGEGTKKMSEAMDAPDIPRRLSIVSSGLAIAVGLFWTINSIKHYF